MERQASILLQVCRTVGEQRNIWRHQAGREGVWDNRWRCLLLRQMFENNFAIVLSTRASNFVELAMKELLQAIDSAAHTRMMKFYFKGLQFRKQRFHMPFNLCD